MKPFQRPTDVGQASEVNVESVDQLFDPSYTMSTATGTRPAKSPWSSHSQSRSHQRPSTTPHGLPSRTPGSVGQPQPPRSPHTKQTPSTPSPSYFGLIVEAANDVAESNATGHVKKNWSTPTPIAGRSTAIPASRHIPLDSNPDLEAFRRRSESNSFSLGHGNLPRFSTGTGSASRLPTLGSLAEDASRLEQPAPLSCPAESQISLARSSLADAMEIDRGPGSPASMQPDPTGGPSFFDIPRNASPINLTPFHQSRSQISFMDERHSRLSLPQNRMDPPSPHYVHASRADTLPTTLKSGGPAMITPQAAMELLKDISPDKILLLDLRVSPQFVQSRIISAINLCIPTTLLKRPSFNVQKLTETFTDAAEREKFSSWKQMSHILVYDAHSSNLNDATSSVNTLKKFTNEGWKGQSNIIQGGFREFSKQFSKLVDKRSSLSLDSTMPVAGGCPMPATRSAANPFFGNIRQNMDLVDGVGQIAIHQPGIMTEKIMAELPAWIRKITADEDKGKIVAGRFLKIEQAEQQRMQKALSTNVFYGSPVVGTPSAIQISGIEKGAKNRYKDILPFDHSRVRLQNVPVGGCDYINASHIKAAWSHRRYIASQAPVPTTFEDFWRVVWEQDARLIVSLTAETEGGHRKSHPYWLPSNYGPFKLRHLSEKCVALESTSNLLAGRSHPSSPAQERPQVVRRRATNPHGVAVQQVVRDVAPEPSSSSTEVPHVTIRKLTLSHSTHPFQPMREITQLHYSGWPDLGTPAHPTHLLGLVAQCDAIIRSYSGTRGLNPDLPAQEGERPIVVHCSAGCGRTGTFCTVDSVIDMLKRQRLAGQTASHTLPGDAKMDIDDDWMKRDDIDLVAKTVEDLRLQRLSMVQTLRQFVLCYESVLEWMVKEMPERFKRDGLRRSYQG